MPITRRATSHDFRRSWPLCSATKVAQGLVVPGRCATFTTGRQTFPIYASESRLCVAFAVIKFGRSSRNEMITDINQLLKTNISWKDEVAGGIEFYAYVGADLCQLTMNDYPDEPLYTLRWQDKSVELDDRPSGWVLPK